jgi:hypothetical protein
MQLVSGDKPTAFTSKWAALIGSDHRGREAKHDLRPAAALHIGLPARLLGYDRPLASEQAARLLGANRPLTRGCGLQGIGIIDRIPPESEVKGI